MQLIWLDYTDAHAETVESWMDAEAKRETGCDDGWADYIDDLRKDPTIRFGENFWCKMIFADGIPATVIAMGEENGELVVSEIVTAPEKRRQGIGSAALTELLVCHRQILGKGIKSAMAVIFPDNIPSQKAFEKAGFCFESSHPDGDAWYYRWYNR